MRRFLAEWPSVELPLTESPSDEELQRLVERGEPRPRLRDATRGRALRVARAARGPLRAARAGGSRARAAGARQPRRPGRPDADRQPCPPLDRARGGRADAARRLRRGFRSTTTARCRDSSAPAAAPRSCPCEPSRDDERVRILDLDPEIPYRRSRSLGTATATAPLPPAPSWTSRRRSVARSPNCCVPKPNGRPRAIAAPARTAPSLSRMYEWRQRAREDTDLLGRDRAVEVIERDERADPERPAPPVTLRSRRRGDLHDREHRPPDARVADRKIALGHRRPAGRRVPLERETRRRERSIAAPRDRASARCARSRPRSPGRSRCTCRRSRSAPRGARVRSAASP